MRCRSRCHWTALFVASAVIMAPSTGGASPWLIAAPEVDAATGVEPAADEASSEATTSEKRTPRAEPPPPSAAELELDERGRRSERMAVAGYVLVSVGGLGCLIFLPIYITGHIYQRQDTIFQEADDPELARKKRLIGGSVELAGLAVAGSGATLAIVGNLRKRRYRREADVLRSQRLSAGLNPWVGPGGGGLVLRGSF